MVAGYEYIVKRNDRTDRREKKAERDLFL